MNGFYTETLNDLRQGLIKASDIEYQIMVEIEKFEKENKGYFEKLEGRTIEYRGRKIPVNIALALYMTSKRKHAVAGLALSGFKYEDGDAEKEAEYAKYTIQFFVQGVCWKC